MEDTGEIVCDATPVVSVPNNRAKMPMTQALFEEALTRMACDVRSLKSVCEDADMPSRWQVVRWIEASDVEEEERAERRAQYAHARALLVDGWVEETLEIADDARNDWMTRKRRDGSEDEVLDDEHVRRSDIRIKTRQWLAERLESRKYGSSSQVRHADADGGKLPSPDAKPPSIQFVVVDAPPRDRLADMRDVTPERGS